MPSAPGNENDNPFVSPSHSESKNGNVHRDQVFKSFTFVAMVLTVIVGLLLVGTAIYNTSLWQNGARPPLDVSKKILWTQMLFVLALFASMMFHLVTMLIHLINGDNRNALMSITGTVFSFAALVFTMFFDQGSIFHQ